MRSTLCLTVTICMLMLILPAPADAQFTPCGNATPVSCGDFINGNGDDNGEFLIFEFGCPGMEGMFMPGAEVSYLLELTEETQVTATADPTNWNAGLGIVGEALPGVCDPTNMCIVAADDGWIGTPESVTALLPPGRYYIVVEGAFDIFQFGPFTLEVTCGPSGCVDDDGDGYDAFDATDCPSGDDCCDSGSEPSLGCSPANDSSINPGATEVCEDLIDNDCDGSDDTCPSLCVDDDSDGYDGFHATDCPTGDDCCDTGSESSLGCTPANDSSINPGTTEVCDDGIDNDCEGTDEVCPTCGLHAVVNCGDSGSASTDSGDAFLNGYCSTGMSVWAANEYLFGMTPPTEGAVEFNVTNMGAQRLDAFALEGICDPAPCVDFSTDTGGSQRLVFYATAAMQYSFSVDGRDGAHGPFDYSVVCRDESCLADDVLACGDDLTGDNAMGSPNVGAYPGLPHHLLAPEYVYTFTVPIDAMVTATLNIDGPSPPDLALLVIEEDPSGNCRPGNLLDASDERQDPTVNPPEVVSFAATTGTTYFVLVDGWRVDSTGGYSLLIDCIYDCPPGTTECFGVCVDLNTDVNNCGECGNVCSFPHAQAFCVNGECVMGPCDPGWADCNSDQVDGCETPLGTVTDCATCSDLCTFPHAQASCIAGSCVMGPCDPGWADCNADPVDGCETPLGTITDCADCDDLCTFPHAQASCVAGNCVMGPCDSGWADCNADPSDGCETPLGTVTDCADCDDLCAFPHAQGQCIAGSCVMGPCDSGWADCNSDPSDGCETPLGTVTDCADCDDLCAFPHAQASCVAGNCVMGPCDSGWADCNADPSDGCETPLGTVTDCADCDDLCTFPHAQASCVAGACVMGPCDSGWADCNSDPSDGCETELGTVTDCADCDDLCAFPHAQGQCVAGACVMGPCDSGWADCNSDPSDGCETELGTVTDCAGCGDLCQYDHAQALCIDGVCSMGPCDDGWADCNSDPSDGCETPLGTLTDCADCGDLCVFPHAEAFCLDGACTMGLCDPGWADCNSDPADGCETELGTPSDCAGCGDLCAFPNAEALCIDGVCVMGACTPPWEDCNQDPADGCETDLTTPENCGACGFACEALEVCFAGKCLLECPDGTVDCDGSCVDIHAGDVNHCGGCDIVCQVANGTPGCESDECVILSCDDGFADCVNGYADGCETVLGTDQNCAECGDACEPYPNAYAMCDAGECVLGACLNGFADCNADPEDGCETELHTDQNCSECGDLCQFENAEGSCQDGLCVMGDCHPGWTDCNQDAADGCESDLSGDPENCGACGNACTADQIRLDGQCTDCADLDSDGHHDQSCGGDDCDESNPDIHPGAEEICDDGIDQNCDGRDLACDCHDQDGDGFQDEACGGSDCDDDNGFIHPDAFETCGDGVDQDCDGSDLPCACDADNDGYQDVACGGGDCDDDNPSVHPGAADDCGDGIDQDCDGSDAQCADSGCSCGGRRSSTLALLVGLLMLVIRRRN